MRPFLHPTLIRYRRLLLAGCFVLLAGSLPAQEEVAKPAPKAEAAGMKRGGQIITIEQPIVDRVEKRVARLCNQVIERTSQRGESPVIVFEILPGRTDYGRALEMAKFISGRKLQGVFTVAYIPQKLTGHGVLVALACQEIVMHEKAAIGEAGITEEEITPDIRSGYVEIVRRRKTIPEAVVLGMLDKDLEVHLVETAVSQEYVLGQNLEEWKRTKGGQPKELVIPAGEMGLFPAAEARQRDFARLLVHDRGEVAEVYGLSRESLVADPSTDGGWRPIRIDLKGPTTNRATEVARLVDDALHEGKNFICLWIDSPGGSPDESMTLASALAQIDPAVCRTVAYIPDEARSDAAIVALACDLIVMHPDARLGGSGASFIVPDALPGLVKSAEVIAEQKHRSRSLAGAMLDPNLRVFRFESKQGNTVKFCSEDEAAEEGMNEINWRRGEEVTPANRPFETSGRDAHEKYELAWEVVEDFAQLKGLFGLEDDPELVAPGWADNFIRFLASSEMTWLLLVIGMGALWAEIHAGGMGTGLGWLVSGVCFTLFFWSHVLGGTAGWFEIVLFGMGVACLALEIFVIPGFGVFGLVGGVMILASLIFASQTFFLPRNDYQTWQLTKNLLTMCLSGVGVMALAVAMRKWLPHAPLLNKMMLAPPEAAQVTLDKGPGNAALVGQRGKTTTTLVPSGKVRLGGKTLDVVAEGSFIEKGVEVEVTEALGNRIVVREV